MRGAARRTAKKPMTASEARSWSRRAPAAARWRPPKPRASTPGWRRRRASTAAAAMRSPEGSPATTKRRPRSGAPGPGAAGGGGSQRPRASVTLRRSARAVKRERPRERTKGTAASREAPMVPAVSTAREVLPKGLAGPVQGADEGEEDHVAEVVHAGEQGQHPVDAHAEAGDGRHPVLHREEVVLVHLHGLLVPSGARAGLLPEALPLVVGVHELGVGVHDLPPGHDELVAVGGRGVGVAPAGEGGGLDGMAE